MSSSARRTRGSATVSESGGCGCASLPERGPVKEQYLARLLRDRAPEMLLDEIGRERRRAGAAGAGDARAVGEKQAVGDDFVVWERLEEVLVVIPAHAGAPPLHEPAATQDETAGADADERHCGRADLAQVARRGLIDLRPGMQEAADDDDVIESAPGAAAALVGWIITPQLAGTGSGAARHDRPLHVQRPAAVALVGGEAQMVDEDGEGGEGEVMREDDANAQRRAHGCARCGGQSGYVLEWGIERALNTLLFPPRAYIPISPHGTQGGLISTI